MTGLDLVISDALVIDGSRDGVPWSADVGVTGSLISAAGDLSSHARKETIDARGRVLAPGFIDTHTHAEMASLRGDADRFAPVAQGVTTTLLGADGFGWVGLATGSSMRWWEDSSAIYGPPPAPLPVWEEPSRFLADVSAASKTAVVAMIPHGNLRAAVMGASRGSAGPGEMRAMRELVDAWLDAGAVGMASGLDYLPGRFADTDEIVDLCEVVAARGGVYASHMRYSDLGRAGAWREAAEIGRRAGLGVRIAHERLDEEGIFLLDEATAVADVTIDSYLYPAGATSLAFHVPPDLLVDGVMVLSDRLTGDRAMARELADHLEGRLTGSAGTEVIVGATTSGEHEGRTLRSIAAERGSTVGELAVDLLRDEMPCALLVYVWQREDDIWDATVKRTLADDRTFVASDGVYLGSHAHPRGFGAFPRVLGRFARDRGLISLAGAVHKMTGKPAAAYGLHDRGRVEPGLRADVVLFDPETVDGPGDFDRPRQAPLGIDLVLVGGRRIADGRAE